VIESPFLSTFNPSDQKRGKQWRKKSCSTRKLYRTHFKERYFFLWGTALVNQSLQSIPPSTEELRWLILKYLYKYVIISMINIKITRINVIFADNFME
jgi:hypothetical protein